jgi:hypothetical protein
MNAPKPAPTMAPLPVHCNTPLELVPFKRKLRCPSCARTTKRDRRERLLVNPPAYGFNAVTNAVAAVAIGMARLLKARNK